MNKNQQKKLGCLAGVTLLIIVVIGFIAFQVIMNSIVYFIFTWPIWLGEIIDTILVYSAESKWIKLSVLLLFILIAFLLYKIKKEILIVFGVIEFVGGIFVIWGSLNLPSTNNLTNAIALGAGLFLMVQGAENYSKGNEIEKEKKNSSNK
jgi:hypothetical protein